MVTELKPCPFCGGEAVVATYRDEYRRLNPTVIGCSVCKAQSALCDRKKQAIEAWNRRVYREATIGTWNRRVGDPDGS